MRVRIKRKSGHSHVVSLHCGLNFADGKARRLQAHEGHALFFKHFASTFVESQAQYQLVSRNGLRRSVPRRKPLLHQIALLQVQYP